MTEKSKAQRLADALEKQWTVQSEHERAAAELRRLDALNAELVEALTQIGLMTKEYRIERLVIAALDKTEEQT